MPPAPLTIQHADDVFHAAVAFSQGMRYIKSAPRFAFLGSGTVLFHLGPKFSEGEISLGALDSALRRRKAIDLPRIPDDCDLNLDMNPNKPEEILALYRQLAGLGKLPRRNTATQKREQRQSAGAQPNQMVKGFRQGQFELSTGGNHPEYELTWVAENDPTSAHKIAFDIRGQGRIANIFESSQDIYGPAFVREVKIHDLSNKDIGSIPVYRPLVIIIFKLLDYPRMKHGKLSLQDMVDIRSFVDQPTALRAKLRTDKKHFAWFVSKCRHGIQVEISEKVKKLDDIEAVVMADWLAEKHGWGKSSKQHTAAVQSWETFFREFRGLFGLESHPSSTTSSPARKSRPSPTTPVARRHQLKSARHAKSNPHSEEDAPVKRKREVSEESSHSDIQQAKKKPVRRAPRRRQGGPLSLGKYVYEPRARGFEERVQVYGL